MKPWVVVSVPDGEYGLAVTRRGKPVSVDVAKKLIEHHQAMTRLGPEDLCMLIDLESVVEGSLVKVSSKPARARENCF
jgi:hypothetical protein